MRWKEGPRSVNVEDQRKSSKGLIGGGVGVIVVIIIALLMGADPSSLLDAIGGQGGGTATFSAEENESADFVSVVLADTETTWQTLFKEESKAYQQPKLVIFSGGVNSACGFAQTATGPFYCSGDQKVYIDLSFYKELKEQLGAPGDFAQAYVIAHEVGHHVQNLLGDLDRVHQLQGQSDEKTANAYSVMLELQADCYAGIWANKADTQRQLIESGDIEEAMNAAAKIGDDALQKQSQGTIVPDSFTHGTSAQRQRWFNTGYKNGNIASCDTFNVAEL
jgi:predicted metalloprotease